MRTLCLTILVGSVLLSISPARTSAPTAQVTDVTKVTPLILEKNEGERRIVRGWPGHPDPGETFILKVDPKNGGSSRLVFFTAELGPGGEMREGSVREGEKNVPMTEAEDAASQKKHSHDVIYRQP